MVVRWAHNGPNQGLVRPWSKRSNPISHYKNNFHNFRWSWFKWYDKNWCLQIWGWCRWKRMEKNSWNENISYWSFSGCCRKFWGFSMWHQNYYYNNYHFNYNHHHNNNRTFPPSLHLIYHFSRVVGDHLFTFCCYCNFIYLLLLLDGESQKYPNSVKIVVKAMNGK